jgi:DNA topoisomerase-1
MLKKIDDGSLLSRSLAAAEQASLIYVSDEEPGIRRKRAGRSFAYFMPDGNRIAEPAEIDRINKLAIPPAWTDVWIAPDADGHIQATGRDVRGRKQYRYHPRWAQVRDEAKYYQLAAFAEALPALREQIDKDLRCQGLPRDRVVASIIWLLDNTMIRIGNSAYARDNKSFGLTTLRDRHVDIEGSKLRFKFKGKSGKEWNLRLTDRRIARVVRSAQELPGQHLFQYLGEDGERHAVRSEDVNRYIREHAGKEFSAKNFRTWGGTLLAVGLLAQEELPPSKAGQTRTLNRVIDQVANALGNTRSVCRQCYVHPSVIASWLEGRLSGEIQEVRRRYRKPKPGLDKQETLTLRWLQSQNGGPQ